MFTIKCFIRKNTPELRKKLEELGYNYSTFDDLKLDGIVTFPAKDAYSVWENYHFNNMYALKSYIDCGENEDLFLALAALRDDKPDYQWFVWDDENDKGDKFKQYIPGEPWQDWWWFEVHKATVKELIEHFK
jgi:hypothetical protein